MNMGAGSQVPQSSNSKMYTKPASEMILGLSDVGDGWYKPTQYNWTYTLYNYTDWANIRLEDNTGPGSVDVILLKCATVDEARNAYNDQYAAFKDNYSLSSAGVGDMSFRFYSVARSISLEFVKGNVMVIMDIDGMSLDESISLAQKQANKIS